MSVPNRSMGVRSLIHINDSSGRVEMKGLKVSWRCVREAKFRGRWLLAYVGQLDPGEVSHEGAEVYN